MQETGAKKFFLPSADYVWPRVLNKKVRQVVEANGGAIVGEDYYPLDHSDYRGTIERIASSGAEVVFNTTVPPGVAPFLEQLYDSGFTKRGGQLVCTYFDENLLGMLPSAHVEGLYSCLDYYQNVGDPFSKDLLGRYNAHHRGTEQFTGGSACSGLCYQAFNEADIETLTALFDERSSWHTPGRAAIGGDRRGREAVFGHFGRYGDETNGTFRASLQDVLASDDGRVVAIHHNSAWRKGKRLDVACCIVFQVRGGKIVSGREYFHDLYGWDDFWA